MAADTNTPCYCGKELSFQACCQAFHLGALAPTAEALMRSRYSAFATANAEYILKTQSSELSQGISLPEFKKELETQRWVRLEISQTTKDSVTFAASMLYDESLYTLYETSLFKKVEGIWLYKKALKQEDIQVSIKRNDPCPCGSDKKFKKCCQKA